MSYLDWRVGMKVVCVDASGASNLVEQRIYTIAKIDGRGGYSPSLGITSPIGILLVEADPNSDCWAFSPIRFRPVQTRKTDISIFTAMLDSTKSKVPA